ncbi:MAG: hypothetical protein KDC98_03485, partial [Planctomycetes bacterium]|nr:hypothetical protein [Planctomycetota bacterium]
QAPPLDADRFASLASVVARGIVTQRFAEARLALDLLSAVRLDDRQRARFVSLQSDYAAGMSSLCEDIQGELREGRVLAARAMVATARAGVPAVELAMALREAGLLSLLDGPATAEPSRWPMPAPLDKDRLVRAVMADRTMVGRVVDSRSDRITLRVEAGRGQTFPTVPMTACEPVDVLPREAAEMGFAALHAGDPVLARLWLGCAMLRPGESGPRTRCLAELLR